MTIIRQMKELSISQGVGESIIYTLTTTPWGSNPTVDSVIVYDVTNNTRTNVSSTVLNGTSSVSGDIITLPILYNLTVKNRYRLEVTFTVSGNIVCAYIFIVCDY
jgi:hypothetical protein